MRYTEAHKEETRKKVVKAAAAAVRAKGPDGVGVAEIMKEVGLTHGGFYAHFPSKEALVAAAIGEAFDQGRRRFGRITGDLKGLEAFAAFLESYVSMEHRAYPERGCPVATIVSDLPRQGAAVRTVFDAGVTGLISRIAAWLPGDDIQERQDLAGSLVVEMAGAVSLSRAVSDEAMAERFLAQSRRRIRARAGVSDDPERTA
ncbi:MAG: TetR/AcrR family transcriptional regulator [Phenylobacterium sp.]|uniref:TetR/AcrR family transcriptional regulator n=1 Tax=Phenylobacterium sp. TaxID=1871053 RepID=UPI002609210F|nr:TetR/AcrR family transcriptional regulator [Phenylobacterium sp.]MDB5434663.1 TetR/AcrR family transcriptional regulator [Phenylobacterium sp.]MDB5464405.1 TetR/AcrR family transcriptional regulator [Phenylobacterium sp.]MDB5497157.1 TetR/AcrR family transcriptional regulator [Phenylobacterium sp.]